MDTKRKKYDAIIRTMSGLEYQGAYDMFVALKDLDKSISNPSLSIKERTILEARGGFL